ncbi:MAG: Transcriptional regulator, PaaX family [Parcubacteria group bacterium GW2011_GWA2_45_15]|nr:MAG: Transcriptional regulator, PaaX family [Parcubacteria group bacterium GW2011_GWA2_45_15]
MGKIEEKSRKKDNREHLQKLILQIVADVGMLGVSLVAPNVAKAMYKLGLVPKRRQGEYISSSASKLVKRGLLFYDGRKYCMTSRGEDKLRHWQFADFKLGRPKRWDRKWRVIIFDIPETKRKIRDQVRSLFRLAGFYLLQDSVWVYPYDCEDVLTLLKSDLGVGKNVLYLIVDELENDKHLREFFDLI